MLAGEIKLCVCTRVGTTAATIPQNSIIAIVILSAKLNYNVVVCWLVGHRNRVRERENTLLLDELYSDSLSFYFCGLQRRIIDK